MSKTALARREDNSVATSDALSGGDEFLRMIMQAAANPDVDVAKLNALLDMKERVLDKTAKAEWNQAMTDMQEEMRRIRANKLNPQTHSRYPTYDALDRVLRPVYTKHGFSLTFDTGQGEDPAPVPTDCVRIWINVAHRAGHVDRKHVDMPADGKGAKGGDVMTKTHATGSAMSYGMRYLLKFAFNVAVGEDDDDGNAAGKYENPAGEGPDAEYEEQQSVRAPTSKSSKAAQPMEKNPLGIKRAPDAGSKISTSTFKTLSSQMKHAKLSDGAFKQVFGFPLEDADRKDLNAILGWIKEKM